MKMILQKVKILFNNIYSSYMDSVNLCDPSFFVSSEVDLLILSAGSDDHVINEDLKGGLSYTQPTHF